MFTPENLVSRDRFGSPVPRQPAYLHTQAVSGGYLRDSSRIPRRRPFIYLKPPYAIGSVPSLSGHAIAYRKRSLPRVRRHRASKPQSSSKRVLPWQVTMDQLICAFLSYTHYWHEVGILQITTFFVSVCIFIRLCISRAIRPCQHGHAMLLTLTLPGGKPIRLITKRVCVCVCVCACVFIKLHITAQSGPVILVILCHSH